MRAAPRPRTLGARAHVWLRWVHTYASMISLLVVLFFSVTGVTLNHPNWLFGTSTVRREVSGTLPAGWYKGNQVDWLLVAEELRAQQRVKGRAGDPRLSGGEATISFKAPGYGADAFINAKTGAYTMTINAQGAVAVLNDLHRGRDAGSAWSWLIDLSGGFLALVSLTGIGILLYLKKVRARALAVMLGTSAVVLALMRVAMT